ncbi:MAG: flavodoxin family protein [Spirochaetaceae bacterium]|jgi:multimeric flavodoxin WrbA|nr:flavodoxin family protein [Spirochaetaceae bacterium]
MKVIAFNGSPHKNGTTHRGIMIMAEELERGGISTELVWVGNREIRGCAGCGRCRELNACVFDDDPVNQSRSKVNESDGIILGSPVYYGGIAGTFKCFLDRLFFPGINLKFKAGAAVTALRRSGGTMVFHQLNNYLNLAQAIITPGFYWGVIHGNNAEEVIRDEEGMLLMRTMGRNMAWLLKTLDAGKNTLPCPTEEKRVWTNFIR